MRKAGAQHNVVGIQPHAVCQRDAIAVRERGDFGAVDGAFAGVEGLPELRDGGEAEAGVGPEDPVGGKRWLANLNFLRGNWRGDCECYP